jgi:hypothetical protein
LGVIDVVGNKTIYTFAARSQKVKEPNETRFFDLWRGARVVMEQIANLSTGNCCLGSSPSLSATNSIRGVA